MILKNKFYFKNVKLIYTIFSSAYSIPYVDSMISINKMFANSPLIFIEYF